MMKRILAYLIISLFLKSAIYAQCGNSDFCNANSGLYSNDDASSIAYDNMGSAFHSTFIKEPNGVWKIWGEQMANDGINNELTPKEFNVKNYPALKGTIYKMAIASSYANYVQLIVLTSDGLYALSDSGLVVNAISSTFNKISVNGKSDGLPNGVKPEDVKMMFTTTNLFILTTCNGNVYVLSSDSTASGNGGLGSSTNWSKVMENATTPLTDVIVARGAYGVGYALKNDGSLWTWGKFCLLGNGTALSSQQYAAKMSLPPGLNNIKMIQATNDGYYPSYYILGSDKKVYALGSNTYGQLGDLTTSYRLSWVNAKNPDKSIITDAVWISANEHDNAHPGVGIINEQGKLYTAGDNSSFMIGRKTDFGINHMDRPAGIDNQSVITYAEVGGHTTAVVKQGSVRYGYVGHRIRGSMGDGSSNGAVTTSFDFITPPIVSICGSNTCNPVSVENNSPICSGSNAVFTIKGTSGDSVTYTINNGNQATILIGTDGTAKLTLNNVSSIQTLKLISVIGPNCSNILSSSSIISISSNKIVPTFSPIAPICKGAILSPLPTTSNNGVIGTWTPAPDASKTTTYTFEPSSSVCAEKVTLEIVVLDNKQIPSFTAIAPICKGTVLSPLPITSNNGITGTWNPPLDTSKTTIYTFEPSSSSCAEKTTLEIVVNNKLIPSFTAIPPICKGATLSPLPITSNNGIIGVWTPALDASKTTTYTFEPSSGICAEKATLEIIVNIKLIPSFTAIAPICAGETLSLLPSTSNNSITGTWSPILDVTKTTTYTFEPTTGVCAEKATMEIVVNEKRVPTFEPIAPICEGTLLSPLPTTSNNGITGTWSPALDVTKTTTYTFEPAAEVCAEITTLEIVVNKNQIPDFNSIDPICEGGTLSPFPTTSNNGVLGTWSPALDTTKTTTYIFQPDVGVCAVMTTLEIVVNEKQMPNFIAIDPICEGTILPPLPSTSNNGLTGTWSPALDATKTTTYTFEPDAGVCAKTTTLEIVVNEKQKTNFTAIDPICEGTILPLLPTTSNNSITGTWSPALDTTKTTSYTFDPTSGICAEKATLEIVVNNKQMPSFDAFPALCFNALSPILPDVSKNGILGTWSPNTINNKVSGNYQFTPNSDQCANIPPEIKIDVNSDIVFEINHQCIENKYSLNIIPLSNSFSINDVTYSWTTIDAKVVSYENVFDVSNYLNLNKVAPSFPLEFSAKVSLKNGCFKTISTALTSIYCDIQKGISPNQDGNNDFFDLRLMNVKKLMIFNRYGVLVYSLENYREEWKGQSNNNQELPDGAYFYSIEFNDNKPNAIGWIYLQK